MKFFTLLMIFGLVSAPPTVRANEPLDYDVINKIMDEGLNRPEVMENVSYLSDVIGPRLTNSPGMREAARWSRDKFEEYGLKNAQLEPFEFGRGWTFDHVSVHMTAPRRKQLHALPVAWHPGTPGVIEGAVIHAVINDESAFEDYEGKLKGKVVLLSEPRKQDEPKDPVFVRFNNKQLAAQQHFEMPDRPERGGSDFEDSILLQKKLVDFLEREGAIAMVYRSRKEAALIAAEGDLFRADNSPALPAVTLASEDYDRLIRLLRRDKDSVKLSIDISAQYYDEDHKAQNVWAEIPGRGSRPEIVIAGAHLDSWFMGDGAVDNATGVAVVMEAARILAKIDVKPKRTIRFALWDAEEQGLQGSLHHVEKHFASKPEIDDEERRTLPKAVWLNEVWPVRPGRDFNRLSAYFNLDTGSGRIRGVWGETNPAVLPIFQKWFEPFHDMGAETVILNNTYGTDHQPFLAMGLPGFTFIQDPLDYESRLHHSQIDTVSHVYEKDLQQAAIIMASFLWHAATRDDPLPRNPIPTEPKYAEEGEASAD